MAHIQAQPPKKAAEPHRKNGKLHEQSGAENDAFSQSASQFASHLPQTREDHHHRAPQHPFSPIGSQRSGGSLPVQPGCLHPGERPEKLMGLP